MTQGAVKDKMPKCTCLYDYDYQCPKHGTDAYENAFKAGHACGVAEALGLLPLEAFDTALCSIEKCVELLRQIGSQGGNAEPELIADMMEDHGKIAKLVVTAQSTNSAEVK